METPFGYTTVFEEMINLYDRLKNDMMNTIVAHVFIDVKARSKPYREDRYTNNSQKDQWVNIPIELSP